MRWFLLLPCWFAMNVLAYLLAPILPWFADDKLGPSDNANTVRVEPRLPQWLSWFMTLDNGLYGDEGWRSFHCKPTRFESHWGQVKWLWRNPAVGFDASVLSAKLGAFGHLQAWGDPQVQDAPHGKEGYCWTTVGSYWNLVYIKRFGTRCLKLDLGWQLKTFAEGHPLTPTARYAMSIRFPEFKTEL